MKQKIAISILILLSSVITSAQQYFPGGVSGAETWYIANYQELDLGLYPNKGYPYINILSCTPDYGKTLVNFNHSIGTDKLCLTYNAPLEISTSRNIFFVGEPTNGTTAFSHVTTNWNPALAALPQTANPIRNRFDIANQNIFVNGQFTTFQSISNANINFYHWNIYQSDQKLKSYGLNGETEFNIGKVFANPSTSGAFFIGNFPEFISYPFELSANQKNRVESYLALKYGITLDQAQSYKNSKNLAFWNKENNNLFRFRIFGIGRDNISGLNQLESESIHFKNYLIASVGTLMPTNLEKQNQVNIINNNFIVFGDNGSSDALEDVNDFNVRPLRKKWLSQNTGKLAVEIPMFFKLNLDNVLKQALIIDPHQKIWMLHDRYVTNQEVSDFNSNYVEYYNTASMDGIQYAYFQNVLFDTDGAIYDQYTFGVGPDMIVQARFHTDNCEDIRFETDIVITGGKAPYQINIQNTNGYNANFTTSQHVLTFTAEAPNTYTAYVTDSNGNTANVTFDVIQYQISVNLGSDIVLSASQQQATLNAGTGVNDPDATYQWYLDGILLEVYTSSIIVTEPGEYTVVVTSGNHACSSTDTILVHYNFTGNASQVHDCIKEYASIDLGLNGGISPYTTVITSANQTINQVHATNNFVFTGLPFGQYTITSTDSNGEVFQQSLTLENLLEGIELDLLSQIEQQCSVFYEPGIPYPFLACINTFTLDASLLVTNPNVSYEWFVNGVSLGIYGPEITLAIDPQEPLTGLKEFMVKVTNLESGCYITESFGAKYYWEAHESNVDSSEETYDNAEESYNDTEAVSALTTLVYPNPSERDATFYYEITSNEVLDGIVAIYTPTGALVKQMEINGSTTYTLSFELLVSGMYFICTKVNGEVITDKIIIK
jgi:hypothetical protein